MDAAKTNATHLGTCLCGAVNFRVEGEFEHDPEACHCCQCRKQSGHFFAAINVRRSALSITGEDKISWYRSSEQVERGFCSVCGSSLFWKPLIEGYEFTAIALGLFDTPITAKISKHTFVADKGDYYEISDGMPQSEGF